MIGPLLLGVLGLAAATAAAITDHQGHHNLSDWCVVAMFFLFVLAGLWAACGGTP